MSDSRWRQIESLFLHAIDLAPAARHQYLSDACGEDANLRREVDALLIAEAGADAAIGDVVGSVAQDFSERITQSRIGERVGAWRLVDVLGQGGMGTVYLAERADDAYRARVAIKFVRGAYAVPELARRFIGERQILADLNHPGIARLLDGGTTLDGTPYFVLEFVDGTPIDEWCDTKGLGLRDRIELLLKVCEAVQYAHDSKVVHRDLKPSNVLVTAGGTPKLVDFGIAKLLSDSSAQQTMSAMHVLTPAYASPEQVRGQPVTVTSDVYSLGVVTYKLLAGRAPYDLSTASAGDVERRVCQEEPPLLSRTASGTGMPWSRELRGDLETIVAKALEKRGDRRHASIAAFAGDLRGWLAAPAGRRRWRTMAHTVRRHRIRVVAGVLVAIAATATGVRAVVAGRDATIVFQLLPVQSVDPGLPAPVRVLTADVNGDGRGDIIWNHLADSVNQVAIGLGQPDGRFVMQPAIRHPSRPDEGWHIAVRFMTGDFNGDGREDLIWCRLGDGLFNRVFIGFSNADGTLRFSEPFHFGHPTLRWASAWQVLMGDLDADGRDDLVFNLLRDGNSIRAWRSRGDGTFESVAEIEHFAKRWNGYSAFVADIDGDRREDLVWNDVPVLANRTYVARSWGDRLDLLSQQDHAIANGWSGYATNVVDINGDNRRDIVWTKATADSLSIVIAEGQRSAQFRYVPRRHIALPPGVRLTSPVGGDFNGDGRTDLAWSGAAVGDVAAVRTSRSGKLIIDGTAGGETPDAARDAGAFAVLAVDVNGDGRDDLVWIDGLTSRLYVAIAVSPRP